ncbi:MAG: CCA tRNA nucleotidyltransferase [Paracoccaceae bacterium]
MKIKDSWLNQPETQAVCAVLTENGAQALFVGGCVRNALLGVAASDLDIATDALPEQVIEWGTDAKLKVIKTGIDHGTVTVVSNGVPFEVTTFRRDVETDGRRAVVAFTKEISEDARRRDFTMNALYAHPDGTVVDPLGGLDDLIAGRVRFIEDASQRILEDYLRILRFFRFTAWYGNPDLGFDADALDAIATHLVGLITLSKERVGTEMLKLLAATDPAPAVATMRSLNVLTSVLPGADDRGLGPLIHLEGVVNVRPDPLRRLAALGGETPDLNLRLSKAQARKVSDLRNIATSSMGPHEMGYRYGIEFSSDAILVRCALLETVFDQMDLLSAETGAGSVFPIVAADLMPGVTGQALGERLRELEKSWIASGFTLSKADLLRDLS